MGAFTVPLEIAGGLAVLLVVVAGLFTVRRLVIGRGAAFDCSLRPGSPHAVGDADRAGRWTIGVARYASDRLEWFRVFSLSPRPARVLERSLLEVTGQRRPSGLETRAVLPGVTVVTARYDVDDLDLAMTPEAYTGLSSWLESAPPGRTGQVT